MSRATEDLNRRMLRARDAMDRDYARPLDIASLAATAAMSTSHFARSFKLVFAETPHRYLQRRRVERAMVLLRSTDDPIIEICLASGFGSLGTFVRTFCAIVGESPSVYRRRGQLPAVPSCFAAAWTRPSTHVATPAGSSAVSEKRPPRAAG